MGEMATHTALCENVTFETSGREIQCPGILRFTRADRDAACDTCGARCGALVAAYVDGGPWPEAEARFAQEIADAWADDHRNGHPRGIGGCPRCKTNATTTNA